MPPSPPRASGATYSDATGGGDNQLAAFLSGSAVAGIVRWRQRDFSDEDRTEATMPKPKTITEAQKQDATVAKIRANRTPSPKQFCCVLVQSSLRHGDWCLYSFGRWTEIQRKGILKAAVRFFGRKHVRLMITDDEVTRKLLTKMKMLDPVEVATESKEDKEDTAEVA
jgi:hypothetical protein